jgi:hypothetical protein
MKFEFDGETFEIECVGTYQLDGSPCYRIYDSLGSQCWVLTVYIEGTKLEKGEILVKTWSENDRMTSALKRTDLFVDTGKRVPNGFVQAEVWKLQTMMQ